MRYVIVTIVVALVASGCSVCPKYVRYERNAITITGLKAKLGEGVTGEAAEIRVDPSKREVSERIQQLDLAQARICQTLKKMNQGPAREKLEAEYIQVLLALHKAATTTNGEAKPVPAVTPDEPTPNVGRILHRLVAEHGSADILGGQVTVHIGESNRLQPIDVSVLAGGKVKTCSSLPLRTPCPFSFNGRSYAVTVLVTGESNAELVVDLISEQN